MIRLNILDGRARHWQPPADWYPLWVNRRLLREHGVEFTFHATITPSLTDCDILFVSSRHFHLEAKPLAKREPVLNRLATWREQVEALVWLDCRDSTGTTQFEVLPYVTAYWKRQLLRDRALYQQQWYGNRLYTDYFHRQFNVVDSYEEPSVTLKPQYAEKLDISWSPGLLDFRGGTNLRLAAQFAMNWVEAAGGAPHWIVWQPVQRQRPTTLLATFNTTYARSTVAWQRQTVGVLLQALTNELVVFNQQLSLREVIKLRRQSQMILSLFGWGELCSRDFQTFIAGAALIMPDVSHLETWPDLHLPGQTYAPIKWDLSNLIDVYYRLRDESATRLRLAEQGQAHYQAAWSLAGKEAFCARLARQLQNLLRS